MKTVTSASLSGAAELIASYKVDPTMVASLAGVDIEALSDPSLSLDADSVLKFYELAASACSERFFGIELAHRQGMEILGSVWLVARHAATLQECLQNLCEAMMLYSDGFVIHPQPENKGIAYCYDTVTGDAGGEIQAVEQGFALLSQEIRAHAGASWLPGYVQFRHAAPPSANRHRKEFGRALQYNQDRNALFVDDKTLQLPLQTSARFHDLLQRELRRKQRTGRENFPSKVELVIRNLISSELCDAPVVAEELGISVRTLQHRLAENGTHYQQILDKVRESLACKYLSESDLSVAEIAELLQFSETSAFSRFFRKRRGVSPRQYRQG